MIPAAPGCAAGAVSRYRKRIRESLLDHIYVDREVPRIPHNRTLRSR